jgi:hypothetical protein
MKAKTLGMVVALVLAGGVAAVTMKSGRRGESGSLPAAGGQDRSAIVIAYYFHRTTRCHTCLAIEDLSKQTIENLFGEELAEGKVEWRPVNIEQKGNEHFEEDYKLSTQSLVLAKLVDGKQTDWKNLDDVWDLIGNQEAFIKYVQEELSKFLRA